MTKIGRTRSMKGNDGRRHRRRNQRIIRVAISTASCLFVVFIFGLVARRSRRTPTPGVQRLGQQTASLEGLQRQRVREHGEAKRHARNDAGKKRDGNGMLHMRQALEDEEFDPEATEQARHILSASVNLVNIAMGKYATVEDDSYRGVVAEFCPLNFQAQKDKPPELPMFRDVVEKSHCGNGSKHIIRVDFKEAVELAREFDSDNADNNLPIVLDLKGVVFHESRCGSTLAANSMMALNPEKHRVYSESSPPMSALRGCGEDYSECSLEGSANLLRDVIYMMGRSNDPKEENLFFKFQSATTRTMETFRKAFPTTPWIFLYREPIEVMMSQLDVPKIRNANCVRSKNSSPSIQAFIEKTKYKFGEIEDEEFCAIHLATLCESALRNLNDADGLGMAVNYSPDLVHDFLDTIFPQHFHTPVDEAAKDRVLQISGTYSKNRGQHAEGGFKPDGEEKERNASEEIKDAAKEFLQHSFDLLQQSEHNIRPSEGEGDDV